MRLKSISALPAQCLDSLRPPRVLLCIRPRAVLFAAKTGARPTLQCRATSNLRAQLHLQCIVEKRNAVSNRTYESQLGTVLRLHEVDARNAMFSWRDLAKTLAPPKMRLDAYGEMGSKFINKSTPEPLVDGTIGLSKEGTQ